MAIKAGNIVHVGNDTVVIDRIQTAGPGNLNIPTEKIYELGNYQSVATIRDVPDLTFQMDSFDCSIEIETLLAGGYASRTVTDAVTTSADATVTSATASFETTDVGRMVVLYDVGTAGVEYVSYIATRTSATSIELADATMPASDTGVTMVIYPAYVDLATAVPVDLASQFKPGISDSTPYDVVASVALPFLYVESMSYRFGLRDNATQSASLRGDSIFYNPGPTFVESAAGTNSVDQDVVTAQAAYQYSGDGNPRRVLSVTVGNTRLTKDVDYEEAYGSITNGAAVTTVTIFEAVPTTSTIRIVYSSPAAKQYLQAVHPDTTVKPAAVRGKDINVYVGGYDPNDPTSSAANKWTTVQAVTVDWRVTIEKDEEFGNYYAVGLDFDVPTVNGTVDIKPADPEDFLVKLRQAAGESDPYAVLGAQGSTPLELDIVINDPDTGSPVKRLHIPDARFTVPGYQGRVQTKTVFSLPFESDSGVLQVSAR
jgi:hypothetical protein